MAKHGKSIKQVIFDRVSKHLRKQGKPAKDGRKCRYRAEDGTQCAVGCLIKDTVYDARIEGQGVNSEVLKQVTRSLKLGPLPERAKDLLIVLQALHDRTMYYPDIGPGIQHVNEADKVFNTNIDFALKDIADRFQLEFYPQKTHNLADPVAA